ncbi:proto-oncogene tyrosine-protein kinase ROS isoform X2 [Bacillus rossius redtenbacheri]|uniref:proto-oncogene tyrosine-protein kinase ROS isoform X2 n=1 Tax=Bacillus rossius redtenbacheri TaxID=93214 RepID=UPI002FDC8DD1
MPALLGLLLLLAALSAGLEVELEEACIRRCPLQNQTEDASPDAECEGDCRIAQCSRGCRSWQQALSSTCQHVCNGTQDHVPPKELYCIMGCSDALSWYIQKLEEEMGQLPAPALVADTLTPTSLSLEWDGPRIDNVSYLVQWRYKELDGGWQYCCNQSWGPGSTVLVENLQPYTKYLFRVALLLSPHHSDPLVSEPSVVISTLPRGVPTSPPVIVRAAALDSGRISVSWEPGPFPNGRVLSYVLQIREHPEGYPALKDITTSDSSNFYTVENLLPDRNYSISVAMTNSVGVGPPATILVSTTPETTVKTKSKVVLVLGTQHRVLKQVTEVEAEPIPIYNSPKSVITGVAIHVRKQLLLVADSARFVHRASLLAASWPQTILTPAHASFSPLALSVDWLNDQLYILGEVTHPAGPVWQVARCGLDGRGLTVAVAGFLARPLHMEVDPYNGYLFWVVRGNGKRGLYRLDLADISNGVKHEVTPDLILEDPHIGAFTVDHTNFRLLVVNNTQNNVVGISFNGNKVLQLRNNTQKSMFENVTSLAVSGGLFYWTSGNQLLMEEYLQDTDSYYHIMFPEVTGRPLVSLEVLAPTAQPMPVPVNPPNGVQAIMGAELAKVSWQQPHLLGHQGKGAWQSWWYELQIRDEQLGLTIFRKDLNTTSLTVHDLRPDTDYVVKAAAYTSSGRGPWSSEFRGRTLRGGGRSQIVWSAAEGLVLSDVTGESVQTLIHNSDLKDDDEDYYIVDITWFEDQLFLLTNTSCVYWHNLTDHTTGQLRDIQSVDNIAIDWIGRKLYRFSRNQLVFRSNLNGSQRERLPFLIGARKLYLDAINAFIYWYTEHDVECLRLNGKQKHTYHKAEFYSGKRVMGLTLDVDRRRLYWIVSSYEGSTLFQASTAELLGTELFLAPTKVANLQHRNIQGPLCYFSDHLLWLQDDRNAVIGDLAAQNTAVISGMSLSGLSMVAVRDPALHTYPDVGLPKEEINVSPEAVNHLSVRIVGSSQNFSVQWDPVMNVNYGKVFYEVKIEEQNHKNTSDPNVTSVPELSYWRAAEVRPYSWLVVTVRAFTYWATSVPVRANLRSPASTPSRPLNPRVFVSYLGSPVNNTQEIEVSFRWDPPEFSNGLIEGYSVQCWLKSPDGQMEMTDVFLSNPDSCEYVMHNLNSNAVYYFQVAAHTSIGPGPVTGQVQADLGVERPVPQLLLATGDAVKLSDWDKRRQQVLFPSSTPPVDLAFAGQERRVRVFWISETQELYSSEVGGARAKMLTLNNSGLSVAVDWVGRYVYWSELDDRGAGSLVYRLDLSQTRRGIAEAQAVLWRPRIIRTLRLSPFTSSLYWIEFNKMGVGYLMKSRLDGTMIRPFFSAVKVSRRRRTLQEQDCNCLENPPVGKAMAVDHTDATNPMVLWVDGLQNHIYVTDASGCTCSVLVNATVKTYEGLPPTALTTDRQLVYWSNASEARVYSVPKGEGVADVRVLEEEGVRQITAVGAHLQPYPAADCLRPQPTPVVAWLENHTAHSITLRLPAPDGDEGCGEVSTATTEYLVYYGLVSKDEPWDCRTSLEECSTVTSYTQLLTISGLKPYSSYVFFVALKNYYSDLQGISPMIGPQVILQTAPGAPSRPREVAAVVLSPSTVEVRWLPPQELNDCAVWHQVHWRCQDVVEGVRQKGEQAAKGPADDGRLSARLHQMLPGLSYLVWVRANSQNSKEFSDSEEVPVVMFPEPNNITLVHATPYGLNISWLPMPDITTRYEIKFWEVGFGDWQALSEPPTTLTDDRVFYSVGDLRPKTQYGFKLFLTYITSQEQYAWPSDGGFIFETLADRPSPPGLPMAQHLSRDVYQVTWEASRRNGADVELYSLEARTEDRPRANASEPRDGWVVCYNGTDNYWIMTDLSPSLKYVFRAQAYNKHGWSEWSAESEPFDFTEASMLAGRQELGIALGISIPIVVTLMCVVGMLTFMYVFRRREKQEKARQAPAARGPDVELATLRELPRRGNFVHNTNALYATGEAPTVEDLASLPHIRRDQITLTQFLGSGAFGEVFEGVARLLQPAGGDVRVAVKTLRKGATEQEKGEFLKEAQLMSHFHHEHILQLLGVCLDNDPNFIIMELMEGGDLLSFLRSSRPLLYPGNALTLLDLVAMSVDVARGCRYLEELHFVHRDLACRNCLVSSPQPGSRVVKIGDFGLARDIYKNDYYRKEGEGLLPVRWMSPESLVDGVFTSQSDVWAFGVLVWEIMTLGQQPYPARSNLEVLHHVRSGGRLNRPAGCPEDVHQLMLQCWSFNPESRPTFKHCLEVLDGLKGKTAATALRPALNGHCVGRARAGGSWKTDSDAGTRERQPPKYLELLYDDGDAAVPASDGYEVPRPAPLADSDSSSLLAGDRGGARGRSGLAPAPGEQPLLRPDLSQAASVA